MVLLAHLLINKVSHMNSLDQSIAKGYLKGEPLNRERKLRYLKDQKSDTTDYQIMVYQIRKSEQKNT